MQALALAGSIGAFGANGPANVDSPASRLVNASEPRGRPETEEQFPPAQLDVIAAIGGGKAATAVCCASRHTQTHCY